MLTVLEAAETYDLITIGAARAALGRAGANLTDDDVADLIARASDIIARHCRRVFALEHVAEVIRLPRLTSHLLLTRWPVSEIIGVTEGSVTIDAEDFELDAGCGVVLRLRDGETSAWCGGTITVEYAGGYSLPDACPLALRHAAGLLVNAMVRSGGRDPMTRAVELPDISRTEFFRASGAIPADVESILAPFKDGRVR